MQPEIMTGPAPFFRHQAGGLQDLQVLRHGGTRDRKLSRQLADGTGLLAQQVEDRLTSGVRKGAEQQASVSHALP